MFNCIWNDKTINAYEISKSDITEKEIRIAAHNGELRCICHDCGSKIIYKHGDQIGPHFAHDKNDSTCAYTQFETNDKTSILKIRNELFKHFASEGYSVEQEVYLKKQKIFCHLLLQVNGENIAIQIAEESITPEKVNTLSQACSEMGYKLKWIVVGKVNAIQDNYDNHYIHRYLLNNSKNNDLIIIDNKAEKISQTKIDNNSYIFFKMDFAAHLCKSFCYTAPLDNLTIENNELTIIQFHEKYVQWFANRKRSIKDRLENLMSRVYLIHNSIENSFNRINSAVDLPLSNYEQNNDETITEKIDCGKFKIGAKVYHEEYCYGEIIDITDSEEPTEMRVIIKFERENDPKHFSAVNLARSSRFKFI